MTERRFHVRPEDAGDGRLVLRAEEAHHARRVLRLAEGAAVVCFDGRGTVWRGEISGYEGERAIVAPIESTYEAPPALRVTLAQGVVKGDRMDLVVQKATELGAARIVPLQTDHSEVRLSGDRAARRADRWRRITVEAAKQCERAWLPELAEPATVDDALEAHDGVAVAFVERDGMPARAGLAALDTPGAITVFVGPEGGWSDRERSRFAALAVPRLSLGRSILRAETAAIAALAVVTFALGLAD